MSQISKVDAITGANPGTGLRIPTPTATASYIFRGTSSKIPEDAVIRNYIQDTLIDPIRRIAGEKLVISSWEGHSRLDGDGNSIPDRGRHSTGLAIDILWPKSIRFNKSKLEEFVIKIIETTNPDGIGTYNWGIHIDRVLKTGKTRWQGVNTPINILDRTTRLGQVIQDWRLSPGTRFAEADTRSISREFNFDLVPVKSEDLDPAKLNLDVEPGGFVETDLREVDTIKALEDPNAYKAGALQFGDVWLFVPPTQITISRSGTSMPFPTIRTQGDPKLAGEFENVSMNMTLFFPNQRTINDECRKIIAMFKRTPFIPIENFFIATMVNPEIKKRADFAEEVGRDDGTTEFNIGKLDITRVSGISLDDMKVSVALKNFNLRTVPGFPDSLQMDITMDVFEHRVASKFFDMVKSDEDADLQRRAAVSEFQLRTKREGSVFKLRSEESLKESSENPDFNGVKIATRPEESIPFKKYYRSLIPDEDLRYDIKADEGFLINYNTNSNKKLSLSYRATDYTLAKLRIQRLENIKSEVKQFGSVIDILITGDKELNKDEFFEAEGVLNVMHSILDEIKSKYRELSTFVSENKNPILRRLGNIVEIDNAEVGRLLKDYLIAAGQIQIVNEIDDLTRNNTFPGGQPEVVLNNVANISMIRLLRKFHSEAKLTGNGERFINAVGKWFDEEKKILESTIDEEGFYTNLFQGPEPIDLVFENTNKTVVRSISVSYTNKMVPMHLPMWHRPFYQHIGIGDMNVNIVLKTKDKTLIRDISKMYEKISDSLKLLLVSAPSTYTFYDPSLDLEARNEGHLLRTLGIHKLLPVNIDISSSTENPDWFDVNILLVQNDLPVRRAEKIKFENSALPSSVVGEIMDILKRTTPDGRILKIQNGNQDELEYMLDSSVIYNEDFNNLIRKGFVSSFESAFSDIEEARRQRNNNNFKWEPKVESFLIGDAFDLTLRPLLEFYHDNLKAIADKMSGREGSSFANTVAALIPFSASFQIQGQKNIDRTLKQFLNTIDSISATEKNKGTTDGDVSDSKINESKIDVETSRRFILGRKITDKSLETTGFTQRESALILGRPVTRGDTSKIQANRPMLEVRKYMEQRNNLASQLSSFLITGRMFGVVSRLVHSKPFRDLFNSVPLANGKTINDTYDDYLTSLEDAASTCYPDLGLPALNGNKFLDPDFYFKADNLIDPQVEAMALSEFAQEFDIMKHLAIKMGAELQWLSGTYDQNWINDINNISNQLNKFVKAASDRGGAKFLVNEKWVTDELIPFMEDFSLPFRETLENVQTTDLINSPAAPVVLAEAQRITELFKAFSFMQRGFFADSNVDLDNIIRSKKGDTLHTELLKGVKDLAKVIAEIKDPDLRRRIAKIPTMKAAANTIDGLVKWFDGISDKAKNPTSRNDIYTSLWGYYNPDSTIRRLHRLRRILDFKNKDKSLRMVKAFPTFKLYFIEEDAAQWYQFDDFYSYSAVQEISVISNKNAATQTAVIKLSNIAGNLTDINASAIESLKVSKDSIGIKDEQIVNSLFLKPGMSIMIRAGYSSDPRELPIIFQGAITEVNPGQIVEIIAQSWGVELTTLIGGGGGKKAGWYGTVKGHGDVATWILNMVPGLEHFGKYSLLGANKNDNVRITGAGWTSGMSGRLNLASMLTGLPVGAFPNNDPRDDNVFLHYNTNQSNLADKTFDWRVYNQTAWDALQELVLQHPDYIVTTLPYNENMPVGVGDIRNTIYIGPKTGFYKYTDLLEFGSLQSKADLINDKKDRLKLAIQEYKNIKDTPVSGKNLGRNIKTVSDFVINTNRFAAREGGRFAFTGFKGTLEALSGTGSGELDSSSKRIQEEFLQKTTDVLTYVKELSVIFTSFGTLKNAVEKNVDKFVQIGFRKVPTGITRVILEQLESLTDVSGLPDAADWINRIAVKFSEGIATTNIRNFDIIPILLDSINAEEIASFTNTVESLYTDEHNKNPQFKRVSNDHFIDSNHHIINNNIIASADNYYNKVVMSFMDEPVFYPPYERSDFKLKDTDKGTGTELGSVGGFFGIGSNTLSNFEFILDDNIRDEFIRIYNTFQKNIDTNWYDSYKRYIKAGDAWKLEKHDVANKSTTLGRWDLLPVYLKTGVNILSKQVERMYTGTITIIGDPTIKPWDKIHIEDDYTDMRGEFEVEQVVHTISPTTGFTTTITPNLVTHFQNPEALNDDKYVNRVMSLAHRRSVIPFIGGTADRALLQGAAVPIDLLLKQNFKISDLKKGKGAKIILGKLGAGLKGIKNAGFLKTLSVIGSKSGAQLLRSVPGLAYAGAGPIGWGVAIGSILYGVYGAYKAHHRFVEDRLGKMYGRDCINVSPLVYKGLPYVAGMNGSRKDTISAHIFSISKQGDLWQRIGHAYAPLDAQILKAGQENEIGLGTFFRTLVGF